MRLEMERLTVDNFKRALEKMGKFTDEKGNTLSSGDLFKLVNKKYEKMFGWKNNKK